MSIAWTNGQPRRVSIRTGLPVLLALLLSPAASRTLLADDRSASKAATAQLEAKLRQEHDALKAQGYSQIEAIAIEPLGKGDTRRFVLRLTRNTAYALIAGCGEDCRHVEIAIFDADRKQLSRSVKKSDIAIFAGAPDQTSLYEIEVTQPGCRTATCPTGFLVLQQGGDLPKESIVVAANRAGAIVGSEAQITSAPTAGTSTPSTTPATAAASATPSVAKTTAAATPSVPLPVEKAEIKPVNPSPPKSVLPKNREAFSPPRQVNMERRFDTEIRGRNYRRLSNTSLTACERACVSDTRCNAVEFYPGNQSCGFFDQSPAFGPARGIAASVKRIAVQ